MVTLNNTKAEIFAELEDTRKKLSNIQKEMDNKEDVTAENVIDFILALPRAGKQKILEQTYRTQKGWRFKTMIHHNIIV